MSTATALPEPHAALARAAQVRVRGLHPALVFALLLIVAAALRWDTFGDPNMHGDEVFYQTVGVAMHHGAVPYVDVWDRKPFGLFALSWLIAFFSADMIAFQIAALLFAAATAWTIARISSELMAPREGPVFPQAGTDHRGNGSRAIRDSFQPGFGPLLAGIAYLLWLPVLQGYGGQSPVFYNLFVAVAALLTLRAASALRAGQVPRATYLAMLFGGVAITVKTSAGFEAAALGLYATWLFWRSGAGFAPTLHTAALWALCGAAPALAIAGVYAATGHWSEYWQAMVGANLDKPLNWANSLANMRATGFALAMIAGFAAIGITRLRGPARQFLLVWLGAALIGLCAMPNFYLHYSLPVLVPLCVAASAFLARQPLGSAAVAFLAFISLSVAPLQPGHAAQSAAAIERLETLVRVHVGKGPLLLYDAPPQLYVRTGQPFITPLVFPTHLAHLIEKDVSHLDTLAETRRVLALNPGAVVIAHPLRNGPANRETHRLVLDHVARNCHLIDMVPTLERSRTDTIAVWGDCRRALR